MTPVQVAALFVETDGAYFGLEGVDPWDIRRDARNYVGPHPIVAHPPCHLWVNLAAVNWKRYGRQRPAWYQGGTDGGCFATALAALRRCGGVIEHPAFSHAWEQFGLLRPSCGQWTQSARVDDRGWSEWTCEVWQSAYGHKARKRTWLYYVGDAAPEDMNWEQIPGTHQVGWFDRIKPTLDKKTANATPPAFRDALINLARSSRADLRAA